MFAETLQRQWYRWWPSHLLGEVLAKRWTETAVPFFVLLAVLWGLASAIPGLLDVVSLSDMARQYGEIGLIVLGLALVMIGGGVDISLGSTFAVANFAALSAVHLASWPAWAGVTVGVVVGALLGAVNGVLVGYLRLRAFLTTLITLIVYRAFYDLLILRFGTAISGVVPESVAWEYLKQKTRSLSCYRFAVLLVHRCPNQEDGEKDSAIPGRFPAAEFYACSLFWLSFLPSQGV